LKWHSGSEMDLRDMPARQGGNFLQLIVRNGNRRSSSLMYVD